MDDLNVFKYGYLPLTYWKNWLNNVRQFFRNIKYAWQRATKGYCSQDIWNLDSYLLLLLRDSIKELADTTHSYPALDDDDINTEEKWDNYLRTMSHLFDKSIDRTFDDFQYYKNPFEEEYEKYLMTDDRWIKKENPDGSTTYSDNSTEEQQELSKAYFKEEEHIYKLRVADREKAFKMLMKHFDSLWD